MVYDPRAHRIYWKAQVRERACYWTGHVFGAAVAWSSANDRVKSKADRVRPLGLSDPQLGCCWTTVGLVLCIGYEPFGTKDSISAICIWCVIHDSAVATSACIVVQAQTGEKAKRAATCRSWTGRPHRDDVWEPPSPETASQRGR